jgi:hypothetical protein
MAALRQAQPSGRNASLTNNRDPAGDQSSQSSRFVPGDQLEQYVNKPAIAASGAL